MIHEYCYTKIVLPRKPVSALWIREWEARKDWWSTYGDGDILWNLEYWYERYVKPYNAVNMPNSRPRYIKGFVLSCAFISLLYSPIYIHRLLFHYVVSVRSKCSGSPIDAAWNRSDECTIISVIMIDISTVISYQKQILHTFVTLSTCVSARLCVVSLLSSCAVWGTDHVTPFVRLDVETWWWRGWDVKICEKFQMSCKCEESCCCVSLWPRVLCIWRGY